MSTLVVERTIIMLAPQNLVIDESAIRADAFIQMAAGLSQGNRMWFSAVQVDVLSGTNFVIHPGVSLVFTLLSSDDATVVAAAPTFIANWPGWVIITHTRQMQLG